MTTQATTLRGVLVSPTEPLQSVAVTTVETWKAIQRTIDGTALAPICLDCEGLN
ncbi:hypothetical protein [Rathayibacter rathayi]|uniref:hypothetical protein n=1 Tax=Rathayibacter rathayi TaxID=33887 RepID=UPI0015E1FD82|nr:hypothetical protein [Rathayibacter rathayi]